MNVGGYDKNMNRNWIVSVVLGLAYVAVSEQIVGQSTDKGSACFAANPNSEQLETYDEPIKLASRRIRIMTESGSSVTGALLIVAHHNNFKTVWSGKLQTDGRSRLPTLKKGKYSFLICAPGFNNAHFVLDVTKRLQLDGERIFKVRPS